MTKKYGMAVSIILTFIYLAIGYFLLKSDWPEGIAIGSVFIAIGIFNFINGTLFHPDEPQDERAALIRQKSGLIAYIVLQILILLLTLLVIGGAIKVTINILIIILIMSILIYPIVLIFNNKKM